MASSHLWSSQSCVGAWKVTWRYTICEPIRHKIGLFLLPFLLLSWITCSTFIESRLVVKVSFDGRVRQWLSVSYWTRNTFYGTRYLSHCSARFAFNPLFINWVNHVLIIFYSIYHSCLLLNLLLNVMWEPHIIGVVVIERTLCCWCIDDTWYFFVEVRTGDILSFHFVN